MYGVHIFVGCAISQSFVHLGGWLFSDKIKSNCCVRIFYKLLTLILKSVYALEKNVNTIFTQFVLHYLKGSYM